MDGMVLKEYLMALSQPPMNHLHLGKKLREVVEGGPVWVSDKVPMLQWL